MSTLRYFTLGVITRGGHRVIQVAARDLDTAIKDAKKLFPGSVPYLYRERKKSKVFSWVLPLMLLVSSAHATTLPKLTELFRKNEAEYSLPKGLLSAVCWVESTHKQRKYPHYDGGSFSYGVCHVKIGTARQVGYTGPVNQLQRPENSIMVAARYLQHCLEKNAGDRNKALTAYNAGTHNRKRFKRSSRYVVLVLLALKEGR